MTQRRRLSLVDSGRQTDFSTGSNTPGTKRGCGDSGLRWEQRKPPPQRLPCKVYCPLGFVDPSHSPHRSGFDWRSLPKGALVVDVGGGVGTVVSVLVKALPDLMFVIQDRQAVIEDGLKVRPVASGSLNN